MAAKIAVRQGVETVEVRRAGPDDSGGYMWTIQYPDSYKINKGTSNVRDLIIDESSLQGLSPESAEVIFSTLHEGVEKKYHRVDIHIQHKLEVQRIAITGNSLENEVQELQISNAVGGAFRLEMGSFSTGNIAFSALAEEVQEALMLVPSVGAVNVTRRDIVGADTGYVWRIEFAHREGDISLLVVDANGLQGNNVDVSIREAIVGVVPEVQRISTEATGNPLQGHFACSLKGYSTGNLDYNVSGEVLAAVLSAIDGVGTVVVDRRGPSEGTWSTNGSLLSRIFPVILVH